MEMPSLTEEMSENKSFVILPLARKSVHSAHEFQDATKIDVKKDFQSKTRKLNYQKLDKGIEWEPSSIGSDPSWKYGGSSTETDQICMVLPKFYARQESYWISCSYRYDYQCEEIEVTIRQTGHQPKVMTKGSFTKLKMKVHLGDRWKKRKLTLMESRRDTRFQSTQFAFKRVPRSMMNSMCLRLEVFAYFGLLKRKTCVCKWVIPLDYCNDNEQTEFKKCLF